MSPRTLSLVLALCLPLTAGGAIAQPADEAPEDGPGLIERGIRMMLQNFMADIAPQMDIIGNRMVEGLDRLGPMLKDIGALIDDIANYQTPERLENGDILIRRKPGAPPPPALGQTPAPEPEFVNPDLPQIEL